ncbi:hypothetical protein ABIC63_000535 [Pseudacidovorax sp. 1753]|uniref:hypothetical protein n=1 Tax=Pseudacidovorax sp. 1753 TaxID=3156419 RepID=UPI003399C4A2
MITEDLIEPDAGTWYRVDDGGAVHESKPNAPLHGHAVRPTVPADARHTQWITGAEAHAMCINLRRIRQCSTA